MRNGLWENLHRVVGEDAQDRPLTGDLLMRLHFAYAERGEGLPEEIEGLASRMNALITKLGGESGPGLSPEETSELWRVARRLFAFAGGDKGGPN